MQADGEELKENNLKQLKPQGQNLTRTHMYTFITCSHYEKKKIRRQFLFTLKWIILIINVIKRK